MSTVQFPLYEIWEQSPSELLESPASVLSDDQSSVVGKVRNNNETTGQPPIQKQAQHHLPGSPQLPETAATPREKRAVKRKRAQLLDDPTRVGKVDKTNETRAKLTLLRPQDSLGGRETSAKPRQGKVARRKRHNLSGHDQIVAKVGKPHETRGTFQKQTVLLRQAITKLPETSDKAKAVERKQSHTQTERKPTPSVKTISTDYNRYDIAREELRNCTLRYFVYGDQLLLRPHYNYKLEFKRGRQVRRRFGRTDWWS